MAHCSDKTADQTPPEVNDILKRVADLPALDNRSPEEIIGYDENGAPSQPEMQPDCASAQAEELPAKYPDFAARRKKIFGDRVVDAVEDFLKHRHRDWER